MDAINRFFEELPITFEEITVWGDNRQTPLKVITYLTENVPPLEYVTSVRAIVVNDAMTSVLTCENTDGETHIVPGGRREAGEELNETLNREVLEETGWQVGKTKQIGVWRFEHLGPKQASYRYPYPTFLQIIYGAVAEREVEGARQANDYEIGSKFMGISDFLKVQLEQPSQVRLLEHFLGKSLA